VAAPRLFRLRAEVAVAPSGPVAERLPIARVRVDTGVFHLDQLYDYTVPEKLSELVAPGVRVQLPFGNRETEGIVVSRVASPERAGTLKAITKVLSPHCVATTASLALIDKAAEFYCCNPWDLLRSAIPPRVASVDKELSVTQTPTQLKRGINVRAFQSFRPFIASDRQITEIIDGFIKSGSVLIVAPDEKDVDRLISTLSHKFQHVLRLSSSSTREERYRNFLLAMRLQSSIVVGTRSAVFTPVNNLAAIIIYKESSPDHFDLRSPGWNSSTIARMRSDLEGIGLVFTGFTPSVRVAYEIDRSTIKFNNQRTQVNVQAFSPSEGTLLPGRIYSEIKKALKKGPVLFVAPRKGYGNALLCAHCRNVALCKCGGRLSVSSKGLAPTCVHCGTGFPTWKCSYCARDKQYLAGRGIERAAEEISRAFPGFPVLISAGDVIKESVESKPALVLATPGAQPVAEGGYAAVVVLDAIRFFSHTDINGQERARELLFETASLVSSDGQVLLVLDDSHPVVAALARWNIAPLLKRELAERDELKLPPSVISAVLVMEQTSASAILSGLKKALEDGRLPSSTRIFGATILPKGQAKIVMHVSHDQSSSLGVMLHELQRKRSISKKDLFTLRIDPYSL
jgi:primosomal protein N' (replication factor Y) (superfamily II helicase)